MWEIYRKKWANCSICIFLVVIWGLGLVSCCPTDCNCKWKGGKQSVECVNRTLRTFPPTIDPGTQVLDVSGNSFETLPPDHFMRSGLINLQKIYLSKCRLSHINSRAFRGLSNLVDLDLSHNLLREVPSPAFPDCQGLMRLVLTGNPISHIQKRAFIALEALTTLEISHSGIEIIEHGAFEGLHSLEWLKLNGNRLKKLNGLDSLPLGLKGVWLEDNPWECDCQLLELRLWLGDRNVANSVEPRCLRPERLTNLTLRELTAENFACTPQLSPTTMYQKIGEGKNVSLLCKVSSVPESSLEWLFNGQPLSNSSLNLLVETTNAYPVGSAMLSSSSTGTLVSSSSSAHQSISSSTTGSSSSNIPIEKKSELLILNATSEENGTFLCVARNPAGVAMANFTVRVLTKYDTETSTDYTMMGTIPLFVSSYPNLFIIGLSTVAVIGFVIVMFVISLLICKCSRLCGFGRSRSRRHSSSSPTGANGRRNGKKGDYGRGGKGHKNDGLEKDLQGTMSSVVSVCGGKLDRHLSETSTLTTHTKSNGSVFLLSTSSELGLGDSNPDLIEGVKRVEGDGHETSFSHFNNGSLYCSSNNVNNEPPTVVSVSNALSNNNMHQHGGVSSVVGYSHHQMQQQQQPQQSHPHYATLGRSTNNSLSTNPSSNSNNSAVILEPTQFNPYPLDFGLPKGLNVSTLVRRSPSYPAGTASVGTNCPPPTSLPSNYDLAKYPKEYISPQQQQQQQSSPSTYGYVPGPLIYTHHGASPSAEYYPAYILPPGTYVTTYSGPGGEEYAVATMGGYLDHTVPPPPPPVSCSCGPILEGTEPPDDSPPSNNKCDSGHSPGQFKNTMSSSKNIVPSHKTQGTETSMSSIGCGAGGVSSSVAESSSLNLGEKTSSDKCNNRTLKKLEESEKSGGASVSVGSSSSSSGSAGSNNNNNNLRLQRQLTTQINESPDEGYEDEGAEGTEI